MSNHDSGSWPSHFGLGHGLAFIYFCFAFYSDGDLDESEIHTIVEKIGEWGCIVEDAPAVTAETFEYWAECSAEASHAHLVNICEIIREKLPEENRVAVYGDLTHITVADCKVHETEKDMLADMKVLLGL